MAERNPNRTLEQILAELGDQELQAQIATLDRDVAKLQVLRQAAVALLDARRALDQTSLVHPPRKPGLAEGILTVMRTEPEREWATDSVLRELIKRGWAPTSKTPKNSVDATLSRLVQNQDIRRVRRGVYQLVTVEAQVDFGQGADDDIPF